MLVGDALRCFSLALPIQALLESLFGVALRHRWHWKAAASCFTRHGGFHFLVCGMEYIGRKIMAWKENFAWAAVGRGNGREGVLDVT